MGQVERWIQAGLQDLAIPSQTSIVPASVALAEHDGVEVEFVTGLNLRHYAPAIEW
jgi:hypothetical protein